MSLKIQPKEDHQHGPQQSHQTWEQQADQHWQWKSLEVHQSLLKWEVEAVEPWEEVKQRWLMQT